MASPPSPQSLEHLTDRRFSFFPAIVGIEHNEWLLRQATWSEILVSNSKTGQEIWMPRRYVGEISRTEDPVLILGLARELEYKGGMLGPFQRRVISMPSGAGFGEAGSSISDHGAAKPAFGGRLEVSDKRALKLIGVAVGAFILLYILVVGVVRLGDVRQRRLVFTAKDTMYQRLTPHDDHYAVIGKLGKPSTDTVKEIGTISYEALGYPDRKYTVVLMGSDARTVTYIGTMDAGWSPIHTVDLRAGGTTDAMLRALERF
jgi:hypothetical protein